ncbi:MAG: LemA family protein [Bacilli bacterium]|jgi:LemA protein|nr:LemA family protein [Bacilli bacterium]
MPVWLIVILAIIVVIILWVIATYNSLISLKNRVKDAWSQIDVQLKRRFDLIPNLVETIKGYTKHESETLENVVKARNTYLSATLPEDQMKADGELTQAINKLFALTESYPDLKANTNFTDLQEQLKETENKIAMSRQFYNDIVMQYNNKVEMVPSNIVASIFKFQKQAFFEAVESERENVKVKF